MLIVTHEDDCFNVQRGGRGWGAGDDWSGTNIVVMNEAIQVSVQEAEGDLLEVLCHIPGVSPNASKAGRFTCACLCGHFYVAIVWMQRGGA